MGKKLSYTSLILCLTSFFIPQITHSAPLSRYALEKKQIRGQMAFRGSKKGEVDLALAALAIKYKRFKTAKRLLTDAKREGIKPIRVNLLRGHLFQEMEKYDQAFRTYIKILVEHPSHPHALVQLWKTLYRQQLEGRRVRTNVEIIRARLDNAGLRFPEELELDEKKEEESREIAIAGYNALLSERTSFAIQLFERAIDMNPSNGNAHRGLGLAHTKQHSPKKALGSFLLYLELSPDATDAREIERRVMTYWDSLNR